MRLHRLKREDKAACSSDDQPAVRPNKLLKGIGSGPTGQNVSVSGARIPILGIAELSLGTMTLQTIVKNASLVENNQW